MPPCLEKKNTLSGDTKAYPCELLHYEPGFGVLRYVIDREYDISGVKLVPGDETIALYWEDRPYNLYVWRRRASPAPVYYFNVADRISLLPHEFVWRDLDVDILVDNRGVQVLDEHELPAGIDPHLIHSILSAKSLLLDNYRPIIVEANEIVQQFAPPVA